MLASRLKPRNTQCRFFKIEREPFRENKVQDFLKTARITSSVAPWLGFHPFEILERLQHLTTEHLFGLRESVAFKGVSVHGSGTKNAKGEIVSNPLHLMEPQLSAAEFSEYAPYLAG